MDIDNSLYNNNIQENQCFFVGFGKSALKNRQLRGQILTQKNNLQITPNQDTLKTTLT